MLNKNSHQPLRIKDKIISASILIPEDKTNHRQIISKLQSSSSSSVLIAPRGYLGAWGQKQASKASINGNECFLVFYVSVTLPD